MKPLYVLLILAIIALLFFQFFRADTKHPDVVPVTGRVTFKGDPVEFLFLNFIPVEGRPSWGVTEPDGSFELNYVRDQMGARTGKHRVWVEHRPRNVTEELQFQSGERKHSEGKKELLKKYGRENSTLEVEIIPDKDSGEMFLELKLD